MSGSLSEGKAGWPRMTTKETLIEDTDSFYSLLYYSSGDNHYCMHPKLSLITAITPN